jgi:hypothetical protein
MVELDAKAPVAPVAADRWLAGPLGGGSQAHHLLCSDKNEYAVKFMANPQGNLILARELGFGRVARLLGDVAPETVLVEVTAEFLNVTPQIPFRTPGVAAGSRWREKTFDSKSGGWTGPYLAEDLARVIVFQTWSAAQDPAALVNPGSGRVWSIDHGYYCQPGAFTPPGPNGPVVPGGMTASVVVKQADSQLDSALDTLEKLSFIDIATALSGAPDAWGTLAQERADIALYLAARQHLVRAYLAPHR